MHTLAAVSDANWEDLLSLLPADWQAQARLHKAVQRLRGAATLGALLRTLLLPAGQGLSLRTTAVAAKAAGWASMSDVALHRRLVQSEAWLHALCGGLLAAEAQAGPAGPGAVPAGLRLRLVDGTLVRETGRTGSQWRLLYSLSVPDWRCQDFRLSPAKGQGHGESLAHFAVAPGDCLVADRGFSHLKGLAHVQRHGGTVIVRLHEQNTPLEDEAGQPLDLLAWLKEHCAPGAVASREVWVRAPQKAAGQERIPARLCAVRKDAWACAQSQQRRRRRAQRNGQKLRAATLAYAGFVVVLTTVAAEGLSAEAVLAWYRVRWQIELAFKRLKSLAQLGHLPKHHPGAARAWLYAKLLLCLLAEKLQGLAASLSPLEFGLPAGLDPDPAPQRVA